MAVVKDAITARGFKPSEGTTLEYAKAFDEALAQYDSLLADKKRLQGWLERTAVRYSESLHNRVCALCDAQADNRNIVTHDPECPVLGFGLHSQPEEPK